MQGNTSRSIALEIESFQKLTNVLPDACLLISPEGAVLAGNAPARELFSCGELSTKPLSQLFADPPAKIRSALATWAATGAMTPRALALRDGSILRCDGARLRHTPQLPSVLLLVRCVPKSESFATKQFVHHSMERMSLQKSVSEKLAAEQKRREELETTAAVFAHELANPLNGISTSLDLLMMDIENAYEKPLELVKAAKQEIARIAALLNDFRALARPQAFDFQPTDLRALVEEVLAPEMAGFKAAGIKYEPSFDPSLPKVLGDIAKLKQAVLNVCKNAIEAMPGGGILKIAAGVREGAVYLEVADTGVGIANGFDPFQVFKSTKASGTGLGLPITAQIISVHKGRIEYTSEQGRGTTFTIHLPVAC